MDLDVRYVDIGTVMIARVRCIVIRRGLYRTIMNVVWYRLIRYMLLARDIPSKGIIIRGGKSLGPAE